MKKLLLLFILLFWINTIFADCISNINYSKYENIKPILAKKVVNIWKKIWDKYIKNEIIYKDIISTLSSKINSENILEKKDLFIALKDWFLCVDFEWENIVPDTWLPILYPKESYNIYDTNGWISTFKSVFNPNNIQNINRWKSLEVWVINIKDTDYGTYDLSSNWWCIVWTTNNCKIFANNWTKFKLFVPWKESWIKSIKMLWRSMNSWHNVYFTKMRFKEAISGSVIEDNWVEWFKEDETFTPWLKWDYYKRLRLKSDDKVWKNNLISLFSNKLEFQSDSFPRLDLEMDKDFIDTYIIWKWGWLYFWMIRNWHGNGWWGFDFTNSPLLKKSEFDYTNVNQENYKSSKLYPQTSYQIGYEIIIDDLDKYKIWYNSLK